MLAHLTIFDPVQELSELVVEAAVYSSPVGSGISVGHGYRGEPWRNEESPEDSDLPAGHLDGRQRLEKAVADKVQKYGAGLRNVILLVEAYPHPVGRFYRDLLQAEGTESHGFDEVWLLNDFPKAEWAVKVA